MPRAVLSIRVPQKAWIREVSEGYPEATFRVISAVAGDEYGVGVVKIETDESEKIRDIIESMSQHDVLEDVEILWSDDEKDGSEGALVQFETREPFILRAAQGSGVPIETPFEIREGVGRWEVTAPHEKLSEFGRTLDAMGIRYDVEHVGDIEIQDELTDKQRETVETALEMGYYDTPRDASLSDVAEELGIAKSTCSGVLHRAEESIIKSHLS